ncbi:MAG TPA: tryptophan synthase subunit alpha [bacterium]|nr:tryptophan synthase subunit alpha [bacterium]HPO09111.1 tryptophan synthase subunit alpha [bacterium]HQQ00733.1 tryptophan synthase subunit alpha [bacterium]
MTGDAGQRGVDAIAAAFAARQETSGKALIPYLMIGDPDFDTSMGLVRALAKEGTDIIELGMPFSDPLADGPVIQRAGQRALAAGTTLPKILQGVKILRAEGIVTPFILMTYYNPLLRYGVDRLGRDLAEAGIDGLIVVDLPPEESEEFDSNLAEHGLALVYLVAPTTTDTRLDLIGRLARGFIYYISRTGVTGERKDIAADLAANLGRIRQRTGLPVVVGFGVSNAEQARWVSEHSDGAVIGSAIVRIIETSPRGEIQKNVLQYLRPILTCLHTTA